MQFKKGVKVRGVSVELAFVQPLINDIVKKYDTIEGYVITSLCEGKHSKGSRHYVGMGEDLRTRNMKAKDKPKCYRELKKALGRDFDVVLEKNHIHIEYDPKH